MPHPATISLLGEQRHDGQRRSEGGAGRTGRHLLGAADGRKLFSKIHVKIQIVISYVFACNKNKALQLQRVPILSILGYNIGSLAARPVFKRLSSQFPKPKTKGRHLTTAPSDQRSCYATDDGCEQIVQTVAKS